MHLICEQGSIILLLPPPLSGVGEISLRKKGKKEK